MKKTVNIRMPRILVGATLVAGMVAGSFVGLPTVSAASGEAVWDGDAGDLKFSTAANWEGDTLPAAGDVLKFNTSTDDHGFYMYDPDMSIAYGGLIATGGSAYHMFKGTMNFSNSARIDAVKNSTSNTRIEIDDVVGQGNLSLFGGNNLSVKKISVEGVLTTGIMLNMSTSVAKTGYVVDESGVLNFSLDENEKKTITVPITFTRTTTTSEQDIPRIGLFGKNSRLTLESVILESNGSLSAFEGSKISVSNLIANGFTLSSEEYEGNGVGGGGSSSSEPKTTTLDGDKPVESVSVSDKETAILNGVRGYITVESGGLLKGNGETGSLHVFKGGVVSPGNSPGRITVRQDITLSTGSIFKAEIKNSSEYDQIAVKSGNESSVYIDGSILNLSLLDGADIKKGDTFTIIDFQKSGTAINGTFKDLPEGTKIVVGDAVFSISYVGGDGNDVVLTALNDATMPAPGTPKTGVESLAQVNPAIVAGIAILAAAMLIFAKRRSLQR